METTAADMAYLCAYLEKTGVDYSVDANPSEEKVSKIRQAIARKNQLIKEAIDYITSSTISV
jgi:hypothetical protein